jgi:hypothetical protein
LSGRPDAFKALNSASGDLADEAATLLSMWV